jgi:hypothetical protein
LNFVVTRTLVILIIPGLTVVKALPRIASSAEQDQLKPVSGIAEQVYLCCGNFIYDCSYDYFGYYGCYGYNG